MFILNPNYNYYIFSSIQIIIIHNNQIKIKAVFPYNNNELFND
jgi:hypothetical protein